MRSNGWGPAAAQTRAWMRRIELGAIARERPRCCTMLRVWRLALLSHVKTRCAAARRRPPVCCAGALECSGWLCLVLCGRLEFQGCAHGG